MISFPSKTRMQKVAFVRLMVVSKRQSGLDNKFTLGVVVVIVVVVVVVVVVAEGASHAKLWS